MTVNTVLEKASAKSNTSNYGYWNIYPSRSKKKRKWVARVQTTPECKKLKCLFDDISNHTLDIQRKLHYEQTKRSLTSSHAKQTKLILKGILKSYRLETQQHMILGSTTANSVFFERGGWFHDPLILSVGDTSMVHIRNMRAHC